MRKENKEPAFSLEFMLISILLSILIFVFLFVSYSSAISSAIISLISLFFFLLFRKHSLYDFMIILLVGSTAFISMEVSFDLNLWLNFGVSLFSIGAAWLFYKKLGHKEKYALTLFLWFVIAWIILAFNVLYRDDWMMENYLTIPFLILVFVTLRYFRLSNISYTLIFIYLFMHVVGSHYTYSEVPFGFWLASIFGFARNHYDRIVHFAFGFLLVYPFREAIMRITDVKGFWALYMPVEFVLAFSAVYELIEWGIAVIFGGDLGIAYLGTQGDVWDAQKDMFLAGLGSVITMIIVSIVLMRFKYHEYKTEIKDSLKIKGDKELGERAIKEMIENKKKQNRLKK